MKQTKLFYIQLILFLFIISTLIISCKKETVQEEWFIEIPDSQQPVQLNQWGVTRYEKLPMRDLPDEDAEFIYWIGNVGAVFQIIKKGDQLSNLDGIYDYWYYINFESVEGWIFGTFIDIYNSYEEAVKKSEEYLFD
ncbi:MAG: hypothetical protein MJB14_22615 [Spirochaetes bacterium]|nr:hypothetical protein [Spirochaetota bacterium]